MNLPSYARAAARLLRGAPQPDYFPSPAARAQRVSTIERAIVAQQRKKRWLRLGAVAAAAAIFVVVVASIASLVAPPALSEISLSVTPNGSGASLTNTHGTRALSDQVQLTSGSSIATSEGGSAVFRLSTGTRLALGDNGRVSVASVGPAQRFRLAQGALDAKVAKLKPGERFVIETLDATVEVRGTAFRVTVLDPEDACDGGVRTRVRVTEGVVNVKSRGTSIDVPAGSSWPANCKKESHAAVADNGPAPKVEIARAPRSESAAHGVSTSARLPQQHPTVRVATSEAASAAGSPQQTSLSHQNDKFRRAVVARQSGDVDAALRLFQDFAHEFPASPLAQNASVEVMRLLARSNRAAAAKAASDYLNRYPTGFARQEAEGIIAAR